MRQKAPVPLKAKKQDKRIVSFPEQVRKAGDRYAKELLYNSVGAAEFYSKEKNR